MVITPISSSVEDKAGCLFTVCPHPKDCHAHNICVAKEQFVALAGREPNAEDIRLNTQLAEKYSGSKV